MRWIRRVLHILRQRDTEPTELASALLLFLWGFLVLLPGTSLNPTTAFRPMVALIAEDVWGILAIIVGPIGLYGIGLNGWHYRRWSLFLQAIAWAVLTVGTFVGNNLAPAWLFYGMMLIAAGWSYLRVTWRIRTMDVHEKK